MHVPEGFTEADVLTAITRVQHALAKHWKFGIHDEEDLRQQIAVWCLEVLPRFDPGGFTEDGRPKRTLEGIMYRHSKNRAINNRRNQWRRTDSPCRTCYEAAMRGSRRTEHPGGDWCRRYMEWQAIQDSKAGIFWAPNLSAISLPGAEPGTHWEPSVDSEAEEAVETKELFELIGERLPIELRATYLQMLAGETCGDSNRRREVKEAVEAILLEHGVDVPEWRIS